MKHKNAEMIKAVIDNVELIVMTEVIDPEGDSGNYWAVSDLGALAVASNNFFLCLPQHKEACLHWLNGGSLQDFFEDSWTSVDNFEGEEWVEADNMFMNEEYQFRIKPKKEKRWIGTCKNFVTSLNYPSIDECKDAVGDDTSWQFHEIEVEV